MDRNTFTGMFLIMLILFGSFYLMKPSAEQIKKAQQAAHTDSLKRGLVKGEKPIAAAQKADTAKTPAAPDTTQLKGAFGAATVGVEKFITLENKDLLIKLTTHGGRIYSVQLKNYKTFDKKPLILFSGPDNHFGITFNAGNKVFNTGNLYFTPVGPAVSGPGMLTLRLAYSATQYIDFIYTLNNTGFKVGFTVKPVGLDNVLANSSAININWEASLRKQEKDMDLERRYTTVYYKSTDNTVDDLSASKDDSIAKDGRRDKTDGKIQWVSFKAHFFSSVILTDNGFESSELSVNTDTSNHEDIKQVKADLVMDRSSKGDFPMAFYFAPDQFQTLKGEGYNLEKQIDLGPGPLKYINRWATLPLFDFFKQFNWNYGLIILALTIVLKLVLSPLTYKSYLSMAKMRVLKPEMDEIKAKVGEDNATQLQQEYLKLYKKAGVNPLGGCLPLVIQMPIVFAFFRFFPSLFELRGQSFLWMHDLSTYDSFITFPHIPIIGDHISLMCLLMTISTLIYTYFNNQISGATGQMKYIGYVTPVIFLATLNSYPAGLNYYYFLANMLTFAQQYAIKFMVDDKKIHAQIQENKKKPEDNKKKKSGFQARMEDMMKQKQLDGAKKR